jgi:hypothetical protein
MENNELTLEETTDKELEENQKEFKGYRNVGIGSLILSATMLIPTVVAYSKGYDLKEIDSAYEMISTLTAMGAVIPFVYGLLAYSIGAGGLEITSHRRTNKLQEND